MVSEAVVESVVCILLSTILFYSHLRFPDACNATNPCSNDEECIGGLCVPASNSTQAATVEITQPSTLPTSL